LKSCGNANSLLSPFCIRIIARKFLLNQSKAEAICRFCFYLCIFYLLCELWGAKNNSTTWYTAVWVGMILREICNDGIYSFNWRLCKTSYLRKQFLWFRIRFSETPLGWCFEFWLLMRLILENISWLGRKL
jgi:hypothetical protein